MRGRSRALQLSNICATLHPGFRAFAAPKRLRPRRRVRRCVAPRN